MPSFNRIPRMFRLPKHRVFDYKPRFYDPEREKFELLKKAKSNTSKSEGDWKASQKRDYKSNIKQAFSAQRKIPSMPITQEGAHKRYKLRVFFIFAVLILLFYLFFFA